MSQLPSSTIRIVIADDHELLREGFHTMLQKEKNLQLVGEASNGKELVRLARELQPDIVITDIKMAEMDGIEATKLLTEQVPRTGVIALTMFDEDHLIVDMLEAGARGYIVKTAKKEEILEAIYTVNRNEPYYCRYTSARLAAMIARSSKLNRLNKVVLPEFTERELQIIGMICEQYSSKEMAEKLYLSVRTIEGYRDKIQHKMGVKNMAGIVVYAIRNGLFSPR